jgi:hypothetical protein
MAHSAIASGGACGGTLPDGSTADVRWELDAQSGVLTIRGSGPIANYSSNGAEPWAQDNYRPLITRVVVREGITHIGNRAFSSLTALTSVTLPQSLRSIGSRVFASSNALENFTIPSGVDSIYDAPFREMTGLKSLTLPDGLRSVPSGLLHENTGITTLVIPASVTRFVGASGPFWNNSSLRQVDVLATTPPSSFSTGVLEASGATAGSFAALTDANVYLRLAPGVDQTPWLAADPWKQFKKKEDGSFYTTDEDPFALATTSWNVGSPNPEDVVATWDADTYYIPQIVIRQKIK